MQALSSWCVQEREPLTLREADEALEMSKMRTCESDC